MPLCLRCAMSVSHNRYVRVLKPNSKNFVLKNHANLSNDPPSPTDQTFFSHVILLRVYESRYHLNEIILLSIVSIFSCFAFVGHRLYLGFYPHDNCKKILFPFMLCHILLVNLESLLP